MASAKIQATEPDAVVADRPPLGLGRFGVWVTSRTASPELAVAVERLGYGAIWLGSANGDLRLAEETTGSDRHADRDNRDRQHLGLPVRAGRRRVASGRTGPPGTAAARHRRRPPRSHPRLYAAVPGVDRIPGCARRGGHVPAGAADAGRTRSEGAAPVGAANAGAHPYLVTPEYTRRARAILGDGPLLAPEQKVGCSTPTLRAAARRPASPCCST